MAQPHTAHEFRRLVSESDTGMAIYGCTFGGCPETEVRRKGSPSPFAQKRAAIRAKKKGVPA